MVRLKLSGEAFQYDIISLVKAFYPEEKIALCRGEDDGGGPLIQVDTGEDAIRIQVFEEERAAASYEEPVNQKPAADLAYKREYKKLLKKVIYHCLSDYLKKELPWGTLTGVRPTKLCVDHLEKGFGPEETVQFMEDDYWCSRERAELGTEIAGREIMLLRDIDYRREYSIYIGIPFCPTTCLYCSFTSYSLADYGQWISQYLDCLFREIEAVGRMCRDRKITAVYVGGGTPTTLNEAQLFALIRKIKETFPMSGVREFTVEAGRPDSLTPGKLCLLRDLGVTRISINPQSMQQKTLDLIGRKHTVEQINEAFAMAREAGHDNINMDLIIGLPGENAKDVAGTLEKMKELGPDSLTVHALALKRASALTRDFEQYRDRVPTDTVRMQQETYAFAKEQGYLPYYLYRQKNMAENLENIGYAKPGKEGLYNVLIMEEKQTILACGAGASSKFVYHDENRIERVENVKSIRDYLERVDEMIERKSRKCGDLG
ncbi:coproporphyrinogen dehydrogenase HemZ [Anaerolentibacter hominis]|uniref:coproporphyrinogen dehydrogenase HemZ n=1 Tax=Anaerolentibacter hominis TaxID=3079009 RepID=UPI0031B86CAD